MQYKTRVMQNGKCVMEHCKEESAYSIRVGPASTIGSKAFSEVFLMLLVLILTHQVLIYESVDKWIESVRNTAPTIDSVPGYLVLGSKWLVKKAWANLVFIFCFPAFCSSLAAVILCRCLFPVGLVDFVGFQYFSIECAGMWFGC